MVQRNGPVVREVGFVPCFKDGGHVCLFPNIREFSGTQGFLEINCRMGGKALRAMSVEQWVLIHRGPQPYVGPSREVACQCLWLRCLYQAFWGRDWAGRGGQHRSDEVNTGVMYVPVLINR